MEVLKCTSCNLLSADYKSDDHCTSVCSYSQELVSEFKKTMLAKAFVVVFVTLSSVLISVESYSSGAPDGACKTMMPVHVSYKDNSTFPAETSPAPFVVLLSAYNATSPPPPNVTSITKLNNPQPINGQLRFVFINRSGILIKKFSYRKFKGWQYDV